MVDKKSDYNNVPVHYCATCLSLNIREISLSSTMPLDGTRADESSYASYCGSCSNHDIGTTHIETWEGLYKDKYGKDYLDEGNE